MKKIELLAPAGSYETMQAVFRAGADAVYMGGRLFGARAYADNPEDDMLLEAIDYAHMRGKKLYLTVNTLLKNEEIEGMLYDYIKPLYEQGLDAVIVQDLGVMKFIQDNFPGLNIHASTQMTVTGELGARFLDGEKQVDRVVTAIELSLEEIRRIRETTGLEIESFVHGALCYSYSGQCLFSSLAGGRSGNRGRCAQPCRMQYKETNGQTGYYISPKDLCTIEILPDIIEAGVTSLKIEGRMKKPEYAAGVVSIYRKYLDIYLKNGAKGYKVTEEDKRFLFDLFNRGGFTTGYYLKHNGKDMIFTEGKDNEEKGRNELVFDKMRAAYIDCPPEKFGLEGEAYVYSGEPIRICARYKGLEVMVEGGMAEEAKNQPMTMDKITKQLNKLGATEFEWINGISVFSDEKSYVSVTELNNLRRDAIAAIKEEILSSYRRKLSEDLPDIETTDGLDDEAYNSAHVADRQSKYDIYVYVEDSKVAERLCEIEDVAGIYIDMTAISDKMLLETIQKAKASAKKVYPVLPHIFRNEAVEWLDSIYEDIASLRPDGFMVRNNEEIQYLLEKNNEFPIHFDYTIYQYNAYAEQFYAKYSPEITTLPVELNANELAELGKGNKSLLVYGRLPMMVSAQCVRKTTDNGKCKVYDNKGTTITDRMNNVFPVKNYCKLCYNRIYNCKPVSLLGQDRDIARISPNILRLDFTIEGSDEAYDITKKFVDSFINGTGETIDDFTRGHFKRGIR